MWWRTQAAAHNRRNGPGSTSPVLPVRRLTFDTEPSMYIPHTLRGMRRRVTQAITRILLVRGHQQEKLRRCRFTPRKERMRFATLDQETIPPQHLMPLSFPCRLRTRTASKCRRAVFFCPNKVAASLLMVCFLEKERRQVKKRACSTFETHGKSSQHSPPICCVPRYHLFVRRASWTYCTCATYGTGSVHYSIRCVGHAGYE
jgi:hypothetical protein